jgi:hypothetical protein
MAFFDAQPEDRDELRRMMWLIERYRPECAAISPTKFSGTLRHITPNADNLSITIYAFAHFVYCYSKGDMVLADIQGERSITWSQMRG